MLSFGSLAVAARGVSSEAQSPAAPAGTSAGPGRELRGTVVDGLTGKPLARVLVVSADRRLATLTDRDGNFAVPVDLLPGAGGGEGALPLQIPLTVQKPGYLQPDGLVLASVGAAAAPLQIRLTPVAAVAGRALPAGSAGAPRVPVTLLSRLALDGQLRWVVAGSEQTARDGSFHFGNLRPGEYTVMTSEWKEEDLPPPVDAEVTDQYPPMFLGDAPTLAAAAKLHLHAGETAQADLHPRQARYYPVRVPVGGPADRGVNVQVLAVGGLSGYSLGYNPMRHAVEGALPDGEYDLSLTGYGPEPAFGRAKLHVAGAPVLTAPVVLTPPVAIPVRIHREFTASQRTEHGPVRVDLQPEGEGGAFAGASSSPGHEEELLVNGVAPGRYTVHASTGSAYVAALRAGSVDLLADPLTVSPAGIPAAIEVTLRDDSATVSGTVTAKGGALPQAPFVFLLPISPGAQFSLVVAAPDGSFRLQNVVPGSYRLLAMQRSPWTLPWRDRDAMRPLEGKGVSVNVGAGAMLQVDPALLDADPAEGP